MMLNDFSSTQLLNTHRDDETNGLISQMNPSSHPISGLESTAHLETNSSEAINIISNNNSTSSSSTSDHQQIEHIRSNNNTTNLHQPSNQFGQDHNNRQQQHQQQLQLHHHHHHQQQHHQQQQQLQDHHYHHQSTSDYFTSSISSQPTTTQHQQQQQQQQQQVTLDDKNRSNIGNMNVDTNQHSNMIPPAHGSEQQTYSLPPSSKNNNLSDSSPSSIALNFSHDLLQQSSQHHNQTGIQQHSDSGLDVKSHLQNSLDSGSLAVGMNMWKSTMSLNHFKHPVIADHNFLPNSDMNSFSSWTHGNNLGHQSSSMTHHILDSQHLIGYSHHQRSLPIPGQDLMNAASMKSQSSAEQQASFMLNSINHQASTSQNSSSSHQTTQPLDNLNLRSHPLDHSASYNLSINDNQFYNNSRSESRSHPHHLIKSSFMATDRSAQMSMSNNHQSQHNSYNNSEHTNPQATTSHQVAGTSSGNPSSSKNAGSFTCPTCNEVFALRNVYQSHLKTHSQDKVSKAKFSCELCGHSFSQKTSLNRHMKSHTGERPFPCEICAKAFSEKERLKIHMRTHTGEKPFSCGICGKSFSQKSTVKRHQTVHTGEKKFRCDCGKGFANRGNLIAHIKTRGSNHFE